MKNFPRKIISAVKAVLPALIVTLFAVGSVRAAMEFTSRERVLSHQVIPQPTVKPTPRAIPKTVVTPVPKIVKQVVQPTADLDPIVACGPGEFSGQTVMVKSSECSNYTDCGFLDGTWKMLTTDACKTLQAQDNERLLQAHRDNAKALENAFANINDSYYARADAIVNRPLPPLPTYAPLPTMKPIELEPFPSIGPSIPINPPECFKIGNSDVTICK